MKETDSKALSKDFIECIFAFNRKFFCQAALPMPINHFITLVSIKDQPNLTISALSKHLNMSKQQMTPIIDKLCRGEYITKTPHPEDRRSICLMLTPKGSSVLDDHHDEHLQNFEQLISILSPGEMNNFQNSLRTLKKIFEKLFTP